MKSTEFNEALARRVLHDLGSYIDSNEPGPPAMTRAVLSYFATSVEIGRTPDPRAFEYIAQVIRRYEQLEAEVVASEARKASVEAKHTDTNARKDSLDAKIRAGMGNRVVKALGLVRQQRGRPKDRPNRESGMTESECREIPYLVQDERQKEVARRRATPLQWRPPRLGTPTEVAIDKVAARTGIKDEKVRAYLKAYRKEIEAEQALSPFLHEQVSGGQGQEPDE